MPQNPRVFVSYSHDSDAHRARVLAFIEALRTHGIDADFDQYHETEITHWPRWCCEQSAPQRADFVLCVCTAEYNARIDGDRPLDVGRGVYWEGTQFITEIHDAKGNSRLIPVLFDAEPDTSIPRFLRGWTFCRLKPLACVASGYELLIRILTRQEPIRKIALGDLPLITQQIVNTSTSLTKLPSSHGAQDFLGREDELRQLDAAWDSAGRIRVLALVAPGGVGKTSLILNWLKSVGTDHWRRAERVFGWSFYSQGTTEDRQASEDSFLHAALDFFEIRGLEQASVYDKGEKLAAAIARTRTLLVLDGLEPLQYPPGPMNGELRAAGVRTLLMALSRNAGHHGLCVISTREAIGDLSEFTIGGSNPSGCVQRIDLGNLSDIDGAKLLHGIGVQWYALARLEPDALELQEASREVQGHALTLRILGLYLTKAHGGQVRQRDRVNLHDADARFRKKPDSPYGHAFKAMRAYELWLETGGLEGRRQLAVLRLLGLFDRPATPDCLRALREPPIPGLTDTLDGLDDCAWNALLADLQAAGLVQLAGWPLGRVEGYDDREMAERWMVAKSEYKDWRLDPPQAFTPPGPPLPAGAQSLDAHPLLREYFARRLHEHAAEAARAGHARLYEHLCASVPYWPEGEAGLAPLYQAVAHGCRAGQYEDACDEVYWSRISRGTEAYAVHKLGLYGTELAALACFFAPPWREPVTVLAEGDRAWLLHQAAFDLRALGRLREAVEPMRAALDINVGAKEWKNAAASASNLSELLLTLGDVRQAEAEAACAVGYADDSGDAFERMSDRTTHADASLQANAPAAALARFAEAEALQRQWQPEYPRLYSLAGFQYCDALLLGAERAAWAARLGAALPGTLCAARLAEAQAVAQRAAQTLAIAQTHLGPLNIGLDHLTLARAALYRAWLTAPGEAGAAASAGTEATDAVAQAVEWLRKAGHDENIPRALLTRACVHALHGDESVARTDLDAAERIARRGGMRLYLADVHLHRARLYRDPAELTAARTLIDEIGYERRRGELDDATAWLAGRAVVLPDEVDVLPFIRGENLPEPPAASSPS